MRTFLKYTNVLVSVGTTILMFIVVLSGVNQAGINKNLYWSEVSLVGGDYKWTNYGICRWNWDLDNYDCLQNTVGYPYTPSWSFYLSNESDRMPNDFSAHYNLYFYVSRSAYFLLLVGLVFCVLSLVFGAVSALVKERKWLYYLLLQATTYGILVTVAGAILITYIHARGVNTFKEDYFSRLGVRLIAILWVSVLGFLISTILSYIIVFTRKKDQEHFQKVNHLLQYNHLYQDVNPNNPLYFTSSDPESLQKGNQPNPLAEDFDTRGVYH